MNGQTDKKYHEINVKMRKEMTVCGVLEVESFDENTVILHTSCGDMTVEGRELKVGTLDVERGLVSLGGHIDAVLYSIDDGEKKRTFFGRKAR